MCDNMHLFTENGTQAPLLVDVWDRSTLDLTPEQMMAKFSAVKDLSKIWRLLRWTLMSSASPPRSPTMPSKEAVKKGSCWSQLDTILIDDTPSKAAMQPYNHLHITSMVQPSKISGLSSLSSSSYGPSGAEAGSTEFKPDTCLVQIIGILEELRYESNISAVIASGEYSGLGNGEEGEAWAKAGFEVLKEKGIKAARDYDGKWAKRVLKVRPGHESSIAANLCLTYVSFADAVRFHAAPA